MQEGNEVSLCPGAWNRVDELDAGVGELRELGLQVGDAKGDVVKSTAAPFQEPRHGGLGSAWLDELEGTEKGDVHALARYLFDLGTVVSGEGFEGRFGLFDRGNGDCDVIDRKSGHRDRNRR